MKEEQELHREIEKGCSRKDEGPACRQGSVRAHNCPEYFSNLLSQLGWLFGDPDNCEYDNATKGFITGAQHGISAANASGCDTNILQYIFIM